jgi:hypothetical protein
VALMRRANGFGLALKAPRKLAGGKRPAPPPETRSRMEPAPAGRQQPGSRCFRRPFRTRRLRPQYRGRRPPKRSCPRLISAVPPGPPKPPPKPEASIPPKTAGNQNKVRITTAAPDWECADLSAPCNWETCLPVGKRRPVAAVQIWTRLYS